MSNPANAPAVASAARCFRANFPSLPRLLGQEDDAHPPFAQLL